MKILVIIISNEFNPVYKNNITILYDFIKNTQENCLIDFCAISTSNDFDCYDDTIHFKYKVINEKRQLNKLCDFITDNKDSLNYDWYIKTRPDLKLFEPINFNFLSKFSINARARKYIGPKKIKNGITVGGNGVWSYIKDCELSDTEEQVVLDDCLYIFDHGVIELGGFNKIVSKFEIYDTFDECGEPEWKYSRLWQSRNINLNVIGINLLNEKHYAFSGDLNP
jgi:hypothetical protein